MITLDDKHISEFGYRAVLEHEHAATPDIDHKTMKIPGRSGEWYFGAEIGARPFNISFKILERDKIVMQQLQNDFISFLFDEFGRPREMKMVFSYEPDKFYTVRLANSVTPSHMAHLIRGSNVPFIAFDPYKYSNVFADEIYWGSDAVTFEYHYLLGREGVNGGVKLTGPKTLNLTVDGLAVQPIFEISGTATNLKVECGKHSFTLPNFTNTSWIIDFNNYSVYKNGQETMIEIREFYLMPGDNEVKITGSNINIDLRIKYRDQYN